MDLFVSGGEIKLFLNIFDDVVFFVEMTKVDFSKEAQSIGILISFVLVEIAWVRISWC